ncbi:hypothetical protein GQX73_g10036 [Xylaria multiplex]|uniref:BZIP domain-containing protein n=1 Tax=Xylaria multiplex TaxID=323545 RepID=A0A7C8ILQ6_9PEZI|nr:hypothetical protein GQX73_g10036 [Xylaria multiplex]
MMTGGIFMKPTLDGNICGVDMPLYGALPESEESPTLGFSWAHQAGDAMYSPGQNLRDPAKELWTGSTVGAYIPTHNVSQSSWPSPLGAELLSTQLSRHDLQTLNTKLHPLLTITQEFNSEFQLERGTVEPTLSTQGSAMGQPMDEATPLSVADFGSDQQDIGAEAYERTTSSGPRGRSKSTSTSPITPTDSTGALNLKHHREKNRVAARKCRQKAKLNFAGLQQRERELSEQNKLLRSHVGGLREEILDLKNEILRHSCCNSTVIQSYITNAARRQLE